MRHTLKLIKKVEFKILKNNFTSKNAMWKGFKSITYQHTADRIKINIIHNKSRMILSGIVPPTPVPLTF